MRIHQTPLFCWIHEVGRSRSSIAPDAKRETLLQIPNYNFEWQLGYEIEPGVRRLCKDTSIEAVAHFDNKESVNNNSRICRLL